MALTVEEVEAVLKLRDEMSAKLNKIHGKLDESKSKFASVGKMMATAFTVTAIVAAGKSVLDYADNLVNLSQKTGMSTDGLQKLEMAFKASGVSLDTVTTASTMLANRLVGGDKSAVAALQKLGLSAQELMKMPMDKQFLAVADAIGQIQNPTEKSYAAIQIFGRGGMGLLQGLTGTLTETTDKFERMGLIIDEKTLKAADDFGDQLGVLGKQFLGILGQALAPMLPALSALANAFGDVAKIVGPILGVALNIATMALGALWWGIAGLLAKLADLAQKIPIVGKDLGGLAKASDWLKKSSDDTWKGITKMASGIKDVDTVTTRAIGPLKGFGSETEEVAKAAVEVIKELREVTKRVAEFERAGYAAQFTMEKLTDVTTELVVPSLKDLAHHYIRSATDAAVVRGSMEDLQRAGRFLSVAVIEVNQKFATLPNVIDPSIEAMKLFREEINNDVETAAVFDDNLRSISDAISNLAQVSGGSFSGIARYFGTVITSMDVAKTSTAGFKKSIESVGTKGTSTTQAFTGMATSAMGIASAFMAATGTGSKLKDMLGGAAVGAKVGGEAFGALGAAIGAAVGAAAGLIRSLFGGPSKEQLAARDEQAKFIEQLNQVATAAQRAEMAIVKGSASYATLGVMGRDAMLAIGKSASEADVVVQGLLDTEHPQRFADAMKQVQDALNIQKEDQEALTAAVSRYKFTIEELGPAMRRQQLTEQAVELMNDFRLLVGSGIDVGLVIERMSDNINTFLALSLKTGSEVPTAMQPILQRMIDMGLLVDANGDKITDLSTSGIKFSETLTQGFDRIVLKLNELIAKISGTSTAIAGIPREVGVSVRYDYEEYNPPNTEVEGFAHGTGGRFLDFGRGTLAMLHGREAVVPEGQTRGIDTMSPILLRKIYEELRGMPRMIRDAVQMAY